MKLTKNVENLKAEVDKGNLRTVQLRAVWQEVLALGWGLNAAEDILGVAICYCDYCAQACFTVKTKATYSGAYWVCEDCISNFVPCEECRTLINIFDSGNPTHSHTGLGAPGLLEFPYEAPIAVYNADIMVNGAAKFYKSKDEIETFRRRTAVSKDPEKVFRYLGVELEVEKAPGCPPDILTRTRNLFGPFVMLKHDGSLSRRGKGGFEIVAMPATMAYHKSGIWTEFFKHLGRFFLEQPPTTGLHVHVGLNTLSPLATDKLVMFVNASENREFVYGMANRNLLRANPNGRLYSEVRAWAAGDMMKLKQHGATCQWNPANRGFNNFYKIRDGAPEVDPWGNPIISSISGDPSNVRAVCRCAQGHYNIDHYHAVNLRTHRPTVELRMFRGLVNESFMYACLEFADSLCDFVAEERFENLHYKNYLAYIVKHMKANRNLYQLLVNQCWIDPPKSQHGEQSTPYGIYA